MGRRRAGALTKNETRVLEAALQLLRDGATWFHGYPMAKALRQASGREMDYATLYRCLSRLAERGVLEDRWVTPPDGGRPRRQYRITGATALQHAEAMDDLQQIDWATR